jgi:uncharacterized protein YdcH (DUF465 family)
MINKNFMYPNESRRFGTGVGENVPNKEIQAQLHSVWGEDLSADTDLGNGFEDENASTTRNLAISYLRDVKAIPLLNREEELTLAQRIKEGETQIADEALSSMLALRWTLGLGQRVADGLVNVLDVVTEPDETSTDLSVNERSLKNRFRARMKKLQHLAESHERTRTRVKKPLTAERRRQLDERLSRQRENIAATIKSLQLNRKHLEKVIEEHQEIYGRVKRLEGSVQGKHKQNQAIRALEVEAGMSIQEVKRRVTTIQGKKAQSPWQRMILYKLTSAWLRASPKNTRVTASRISIWFRKAISVLCERLANLITGWASGFQHTQSGGSGKPLLAPSLITRAPFAFPSIWLTSQIN